MGRALSQAMRFKQAPTAAVGNIPPAPSPESSLLNRNQPILYDPGLSAPTAWSVITHCDVKTSVSLSLSLSSINISLPPSIHPCLRELYFQDPADGHDDDADHHGLCACATGSDRFSTVMRVIDKDLEPARMVVVDAH